MFAGPYQDCCKSLGGREGGRGGRAGGRAEGGGRKGRGGYVIKNLFAAKHACIGLASRAGGAVVDQCFAQSKPCLPARFLQTCMQTIKKLKLPGCFVDMALKCAGMWGQISGAVNSATGPIAAGISAAGNAMGFPGSASPGSWLGAATQGAAAGASSR